MIPWQNFRRMIVGVVLAILFAFSSAQAHDIRPAYLELKETAPGQFNVLWRTPVMAGMRLPVVLKLSDEMRNLRDPVVQELTDSLVERRWIQVGPHGLAGKRVEFPGLQLTITDVLVRFEMLDGRKGTTIVRPSQPWFESDAAPSKLRVAGAYLRLGVEHIWSGIDHLLFILALMILVKGTRRLIATVTAFTVAHSITLAGATLGFVRVPQTACRGLYCFEHRFRCLRDCACAPGLAGLDGALAVDRRFHLRPVARIRFRRRVECSRPSPNSDSSGVAVFQRWC